METLIFNKPFKDFLKRIGFKKENHSGIEPDDEIFYIKEYGSEYDVFGNISIEQNWAGKDLALVVCWPTVSDVCGDDAFDLETVTLEDAERQIKKVEEITAKMKADLLKVVKKARELQAVSNKFEFTSYSASMREDGYAEVFGHNVRGQSISLGITSKKINDFTPEDAKQELLHEVVKNFLLNLKK